MPRFARNSSSGFAVSAVVLALWTGLFCRSAAAQGLEYVKANYTKYEYRIPMRDGKQLFTAVYVPKDLSQRYPVLFTRTPYSVQPYGADQYKADLGPSPLAGKAGYIFVYQDVRGRWMSEGEFVNARPYIPTKKDPTDVDESSDAWDTIDWLTKNVAGHNGKVGMWGISYPGFYTSMGPWTHGAWNRGDGDSLGPIPFNVKTAAFFRETIELPFFEFHLKGKGKPSHPEAWIFQTGTNQWRSFTAWPPKESRPKSFYLQAAGRLAFDPAAGAKSSPCYDEYVSDPAHPVPFLGKIAIGMSPEYMVEDQRFAATRPDVLACQTEPLDQDLALAGPIQVEIHVATTGTDADWIVKLVDV